MRRSMFTKLGLASVLIAMLAGTALAAAGSEVWILTFDKPASKAQALAAGNYKVRFDYSIIPGFAAELTAAEAASIEGAGLPGLLSIEQDHEFVAFSQTTPWGIAAVQAPASWPTTKGIGAKVADLDTGIDQTHPDHGSVILSKSFVAGQTIQDGNGHGTHTSGTIAALDNTIGVVGVAPEAGLLIGKVLGDNGSGLTSGIIAGIDWAAANGADVINMSLGSPIGSGALQTACNNAVAAGVVVVAAAGNAGTSAPNYPAAYASVVSVSAVDESLQIASFSSFGSTVDLAAPGVGVLSTVPQGTGVTASASWNGTPRDVNGIAGTAAGTATKPVYYCGIGDGTAGNTCPAGVAGNIAHIRRGTITFAAKVTYAESVGAVGVILSNNAPGNFSGTIAPNTSPIPGISVSQADGDDLVALGDGTVATISVVSGADYAKFDGTSMAAPHVAGVAALLRACRPAATVAEVRAALESTALDLGTAGRDDYYGNGFVQAANALAAIGPCEACTDADGDGYTTCDGDCNDSNPNVNPGETEIPRNGIDDDCNPATPDVPVCGTVTLPTGGAAAGWHLMLGPALLAALVLRLRSARRKNRS